jgi:2-phospho-L-lactate guanylyltransferase
MDALIPLKRLDLAKTRLRELLAPDERVRLMRLLVENAVQQVRAAQPIERVILVSSEPQSPALAAEWGIEHFDDHGLPWNDALAAAMSEAVRTPSVAIVSADLPFITSADVEALVAAAPPAGLAIARARDAGTNGVVMRPTGAVTTTFGVPGSAAAHAAIAAAAGLDAAIVDIPGLALDLDNADDVRAALAHGVPESLRELLGDYRLP